MKKFFFLFCLTLFIIACKKPNKTSFYFWKTTYKLSPLESQYLAKLQVQKLYVRFFDIDIKNKQAIPIAEIIINEKNMLQEIIPVVFITNETFKNLDKKEIDKLAENTTKEIYFLYPNISDKVLKEIQFDCDWTESTKNNYFYFLSQMKIIKPKITFSATIRLHQIKYKNKTGVPPINKGVLMYYATENPLKATNKNSILENEEAKKYISNLKNYPLALDVALPIYSWAIVENELGEKRLINGVKNEDLQDENLYQKTGENQCKIKRENYFKGVYLYEDYKIKIEQISTKQLFIASENIKEKMKNKTYNTIFFQLDSSNLIQYKTTDLKSVSK